MSQKSNVKLGEYQTKNFYQTSSNQAFNNQQNAKFVPNKLDTEKISDLRKHHFQLGSYNGQNISTQKSEFNLKEQTVQEAKVPKSDHNHDFAENNQRILQSAYNSQFQQAKNYKLESSNHEQIQQRVAQLRESHIVFGNDQKKIQSVNQSEFVKKNTQNLIGKGKDHVDSVVIGNSNTDYRTVNSQYFVDKGHVATQISQTLKDDLRATHYVFGADKNYFQSEQQQNYQNRANQPKQTFLGQDQTKGNVQLSAGNQKFYTTTNQTQLPQRQMIANNPRDNTLDRQSNFSLGQNSQYLVSEQKTSYMNPQVDNVKIQEGQVRTKSHLQFNDVKQNLYQTEQKTEFKNPQQSSVQAMILQSKDQSNFILGNEPTKQYVSSTKDAFKGYAYQEPAKFKVQDPRKSNFKLG